MNINVSGSRTGSSATALSSRDTRRARFLATASSRASGRARSALGQDDEFHSMSEISGEFIPRTHEEKLIARFDPHGIRRQTRKDEPALQEEKENDVLETGARQTCYFCVACEVIVVRVPSGDSPTIETVQAVYHHCGSALHRRSIRYMALEETDAALTVPIQIDPNYYRIIVVNGLRTLVCTLPHGGGILHNKVYHAGELAGQDEDDDEEEQPNGGGPARKTRPPNNSFKLHRPRQTFFTESWIRPATVRDTTITGDDDDNDKRRAHNGREMPRKKKSTAMSSRRLVNYRYARVPMRFLRDPLEISWQQLTVQTVLADDDQQEKRGESDLHSENGDDHVEVPRVRKRYRAADGEAPILLEKSTAHIPVCDGNVYRMALRSVNRLTSTRQLRRDEKKRRAAQQAAMSQLTEDALRIHSQREGGSVRIGGAGAPRGSFGGDGDDVTDDFSHIYSSSSGASSLQSVQS